LQSAYKPSCFTSTLCRVLLQGPVLLYLKKNSQVAAFILLPASTKLGRPNGRRSSSASRRSSTRQAKDSPTAQRLVNSWLVNLINAKSLVEVQSLLSRCKEILFAHVLECESFEGLPTPIQRDMWAAGARREMVSLSFTKGWYHLRFRRLSLRSVQRFRPGK